MICTTCNKPCNGIKSVIDKGQILTGCDHCINRQYQQGSGTTNQYYKREQQTKFRKELTQPVEPREFIQAYGADGARNRGFSEETIRKYS